MRNRWAGLVASTAILAVSACGGSGGATATTAPGTTLPPASSDPDDGGSSESLTLPDDETIKGAFGSGATITRPSPQPAGTLRAACSGDEIAYTALELIAVKGQSPEGAPVQFSAFLYTFGAASDASAYFDSWANGQVDCEWDAGGGERHGLGEITPLDDVGGARRVRVFAIDDVAQQTGTFDTLLQRDSTVVNLGGDSSSSTGAAALQQIAELVAA